MNQLWCRQRRAALHGPVPSPLWTEPLGDTEYGSRGHGAFPSQASHQSNHPLSPPPPYEMIEDPSPIASQPNIAHDRSYQSQQRGTDRKNHPRWASTPTLPRDGTPAPGGQGQGWQSATNLMPPPIAADGFADCPITRSMNQGAAFCDVVASRLNDVLRRVESEDAREADIDALAQELMIEEDVERERSAPAARSRPSDEQPKSGLINFRKTWLYANSRLPPQMVPFKLYLPTWQILCRAADASAAVYNRPQDNESQEYINADWRQGTKAMALKSVCIDEKNLIVFAIRGSKWNLVDWAVNFRPAPKEPVGFLDDQGNACHAGFLQVARAMVRPVAARLRHLLEQNPGRASSSLVLTGHSAGGAVASLLYMHMLSKTVESELNILTGCFRRVHCVTFGAPPVSLLPLQKPEDKINKKNVFIAFANEGDVVVRADKGYIYSVARLIAAPAPLVAANKPRVLRSKKSELKLKQSTAAPVWPVPEATLSNAGRLVLLRKTPGQRKVTEAVCVSDQQLRYVIFGDPSMHDMELYKRRVDELAIAAVTGRDEA